MLLLITSVVTVRFVCPAFTGKSHFLVILLNGVTMYCINAITDRVVVLTSLRLSLIAISYAELLRLK